MNKTIISIIVLVIVTGGLYFVLKNKTTEAPTFINDNQIGQEGETGGELDNITGTSTTATTSTTTTTNTTTETPAVKEFTVTGKNFSFTPSTMTVQKGDKVKITFKNTQGMHDFRIDEFGVATPQAQSPDTEVLEFIANKTGSFEYYCSVGSHRAMGMKGTLVVQ